jgi:hypothetical protein
LNRSGESRLPWCVSHFKGNGLVVLCSVWRWL